MGHPDLETLIEHMKAEREYAHMETRKASFPSDQTSDYFRGCEAAYTDALIHLKVLRAAVLPRTVAEARAEVNELVVRQGRFRVDELQARSNALNWALGVESEGGQHE